MVEITRETTALRGKNKGKTSIERIIYICSNRNAILVLGILRGSAVGIFYHWRRHRKNLRQSTFKDFHDAMNRFNHTSPSPPSPPAATDPVQKSAVLEIEDLNFRFAGSSLNV